MPLTEAALNALNLGYLAGKDLRRWCAPSLLIKQYETDNAALQDAADSAYGFIKSQLANRYNIEAELAKASGDATRIRLCIDITAIVAVSNAMAGMAGISENMMQLFKTNLKTIHDLRSGQMNLPIQLPTTDPDTGITRYSLPQVINSSFKTLG